MPWTTENIHFLFLHFPIALFSTGWACDCIGVSFSNRSATDAGWWCLLFGLVSSLFAVGTGFLADRLYGHMTLPFPFFETHGALQITACLIFLGLFILRFRNGQRLPEGNLRSVYLLVAGVAVGLLFYGAHLGAQLSGRI